MRIFTRPHCETLSVVNSPCVHESWITFICFYILHLLQLEIGDGRGIISFYQLLGENAIPGHLHLVLTPRTE